MTPQPPEGKMFDIVELNGLLVKFRRENATMDDFINIRNFIAASIDRERKRFAIEKLQKVLNALDYEINLNNYDDEDVDKLQNSVYTAWNIGDALIAEIKEKSDDR